ncbi:hypothetical protein KIH39_21310 [Telmatocola sphagniphila]|uniref:Uncharacterized protein n=1 Tax=Telmatocola sphagniphila TaxID=1123043 RepID=A0A8E6EUG3_9BACT|nr:hypothetical protein [Telmatocola sphagniphila]QVL31360.1 hypothetical protein KIH39_21310 [Telmatocola sphagniphila]
MYLILLENPWLIVIALGVLVPITGITFGTVTSYLIKNRRAELDAALKREMLDRGMSAVDIERVVSASSDPYRKFKRYKYDRNADLG